LTKVKVVGGSGEPYRNGLSVDEMGRLTLSDLETRAAAVLDALSFGYVHQGAGDSADANVDVWQQYRLRPRMLRDVSQVSTSTVLSDQSIAPPILVAPTAMHRLFCADGELSTARAAADAGVVYVVSMGTTTAIEDIVAAAPDGRHWMQAYMRPFSLALVSDGLQLGVKPTSIKLPATIDFAMLTAYYAVNIAKSKPGR
jgi:4-hydroxymandelate oxidase